MTIRLLDQEVPWLTTEQMIEVDRAMIDDYRIDLVRMMENAGRGLAIVARERFLEGSPAGKRVQVLAGSGGNGGGALVAARRLHNWGADVTVVTTKPEGDMTPVPARQFAILTSMGIDVTTAAVPAADPSCAVIIDGLIGYSLGGAPRGITGELIAWVNAQRVPVLSLDVPSGIDTATGRVFDPAIRADATMTLALPKAGLREPQAAAYVGELYLADISIPPSLYARPPLSLKVGPIFARADVLRVDAVASDNG